MRRVDQAVVPPPTSVLSSSSTRSPRIAASRAMPQPLMPAPMMMRSNGVFAMSAGILLVIIRNDECGVMSIRQLEPFNSSLITPRSSLFVSFPVARAFDGAEPAAVEALALVGAHARLVSSRDPEARGDLVTALPEADGESGEIGRARRGRLRDFGHDDARAEDV